MSGATDEQFDENVRYGRALAEAVLYLISLIVVTIIAGYHTYQFYNEVFTEKPIGKKNKNTKPSQLGKILSWTTFFSILFYWITTFVAMYSQNFVTSDRENACSAIQELLQVVYVIATALFYIVLALRLYECYGKTGYGYKGQTIAAVSSVTTVIFIVCIIVVLIAYTSQGSDQVYRVGIQGEDPEDRYPYYCDTGLSGEAFRVWRAAILC